MHGQVGIIGKLKSEIRYRKQKSEGRVSHGRPSTYISQTRGTRFQVSKENEDKIEKSTGLIKPGMKVEPGEVMAMIVRKNVDDPEAKLLGILQRPSAGK